MIHSLISLALRDQLPVQDMPAVLRVGPHLPRPAALINGFRQASLTRTSGLSISYEDIVRRLVLNDDRLALAADHQGHLLLLEACHRDDSGHLQELRHVLLVIDLIEEGVLIGSTSMAALKIYCFGMA